MSRPVAILAVALFFAIQLSIPLARMGDHDRSQRFGWQMFSVANEAPDFTVETGEGEVSIELSDVLARVRGDLDLPGLLPPFLCDTVEGAISVTWGNEEYRCSVG